MVGSTEVVVDSNNPVYKRKIEVDFMHRRHQHLTFDVWDVIDKDGDLKGAVKLGSADVQLVRLVRLRGQAMTVLLRDDGNSGKQDPNGRIGAGGAASSKGSFIIVRACRIRREKQFKKGKEEAKEMTTLVWRRVREWRFNKEDGIFEWVNIPRDEQTENTKRKGTISVCFAEDRVSAVMEKVFKVRVCHARRHAGQAFRWTSSALRSRSLSFIHRSHSLLWVHAFIASSGLGWNRLSSSLLVSSLLFLQFRRAL